MFLGSNNACYRIGFSGLRSPTEDIHLEKAQISLGKIIGGALTFARGNREKALHNPANKEAYFKNLEKMMNSYVVLYDTRSRRAWLVYAIQALLHSVQAYLRTTAPAGSVPDLTIAGDLPPNSIDASTALRLLQDHGNMRIDVGQSGAHTRREDPSISKDEDTCRLRDVVVDRLEKLELMLSHVSDTRSATSVGIRIRLSPRRNLVGYDFMQVVEESIHADPRIAELHADGEGWGVFVRWIGAPVLFGKDFGSLLEPTQGRGHDPCTHCHWNCDVPEGRDILSVSTAVLEHLVERRGEKLGKSWRLVDDFYLDMPEGVLSDCQPSSRGRSHESRIRKIMTKRRHTDDLDQVPKSARRLFDGFRHPSERGQDERGQDDSIRLLAATQKPLAGVLIGTPRNVLRKGNSKHSVTDGWGYRSSQGSLAQTPETPGTPGTQQQVQPSKHNGSVIPCSTEAQATGSGLASSTTDESDHPPPLSNPSSRTGGESENDPNESSAGAGGETVAAVVDGTPLATTSIMPSEGPQATTPSGSTTDEGESASAPSSGRGADGGHETASQGRDPPQHPGRAQRVLIVHQRVRRRPVRAPVPRSGKRSTVRREDDGAKTLLDARGRMMLAIVGLAFLVFLLLVLLLLVWFRAPS